MHAQHAHRLSRKPVLAAVTHRGQRWLQHCLIFDDLLADPTLNGGPRPSMLKGSTCAHCTEQWPNELPLGSEMQAQLKRSLICLMTVVAHMLATWWSAGHAGPPQGHPCAPPPGSCVQSAAQAGELGPARAGNRAPGSAFQPNWPHWQGWTHAITQCFTFAHLVRFMQRPLDSSATE